MLLNLITEWKLSFNFFLSLLWNCNTFLWSHVFMPQSFLHGSSIHSRSWQKAGVVEMMMMVQGVAGCPNPCHIVLFRWTAFVFTCRCPHRLSWKQPQRTFKQIWAFHYWDTATTKHTLSIGPLLLLLSLNVLDKIQDLLLKMEIYSNVKRTTLAYFYIRVNSTFFNKRMERGMGSFNPQW